MTSETDAADLTNDAQFVEYLNIKIVKDAYDEGFYNGTKAVGQNDAPNKWALSHAYADERYHFENGDHITKYEKYIEIKESYEAGYDNGYKLIAENNK